MNDPAVGIAQLIDQANLGTFADMSPWAFFGAGIWGGASAGGNPNWPVVVGKLPPTPQAVIAVVSTGGVQPNPKYLLDYPSVQVLVRGAANGYKAARMQANAIKNLLLGFPSQEVNGDWWDIVLVIGDIATLGFDDNNCPMFSLNFALTIEPRAEAGTNRIPL